MHLEMICPIRSQAHPSMTLRKTIRSVTETDTRDLHAVAELCDGFVAWCYRRFGDEYGWMVRDYFKGVDWVDEMHRFAQTYRQPDGHILLAELDGAAVGCVMYRRLDNNRCEMKRLFVDEQAHGHSVGRDLVDAIVASARAAGFREMLLETSVFQHEAQSLYESAGCQRTAPYHDDDPHLAHLKVFYALPL